MKKGEREMNKITLTIVAITLIWPVTAVANPIPIPRPASMPLEEMDIQIFPSGGTLHADFDGDFTFDYIPEDVTSMLFPVPPDAAGIGVWQAGVELPWDWSDQLYPTILPEIPLIPMIEWQGPFPIEGTVFTVQYNHDLIERPDEYIYFYALGTGKYFPTYDKTTTANFDIILPGGFDVGGVWLDYDAHAYEVVGSHLLITVESYFGPITKDLIVSIVPEPSMVSLLVLGVALLRRRRRA